MKITLEVYFYSDLKVSDVTSHVRGGMQMQFPIGLGTAVCFRLQRRDGGLTTSWLHTIRLAKLEHHHPVSRNVFSTGQF